MIVLPTFLLGHAGDALVGALLSLLGVQGLDDALHRAVDACSRMKRHRQPEEMRTGTGTVCQARLRFMPSKIEVYQPA